MTSPATPTTPRRNGERGRGLAPEVLQALLSASNSPVETALSTLHTSAQGLTSAEAEVRLAKYGPNEAVREERQHWLRQLWDNLRNPLVILLAVLATLSFITGDIRATIMMMVMITIGVTLRYFQESRADQAARKLKAMVSTTATVLRDDGRLEIPLPGVVPGDVIALSAGDMIPADVRVLQAKDLFINQAVLTGEALPVEKTVAADTRTLQSPLEAGNLCFMGTNVEVGTATAIVLNTGPATYFGSLSRDVVNQTVVTSFDKGISQFTGLMIRFILVMVPAVFFINGLSKHNWADAFFFALAVAVGLTPEMLPMLVTVNLSKGAMSMSRKKVIVKRLNAIQNFGAMDVLCTDKTGTITQGRVILEQHVDVHGDESERVLEYGYLNSFYQSGLKNMLDVAVLAHGEEPGLRKLEQVYRKVDEIPFDFVRRRMSVVVADAGGKRTLICKGAVEEVLSLSVGTEEDGAVCQLDPAHHAQASELVTRLNEDGFRVLALAYRELPDGDRTYSIQDEVNLTLLGFLAFLDPPKETATEALKELDHLGVQVKILTGDSQIVTAKGAIVSNSKSPDCQQLQVSIMLRNSLGG